MAIEQVISLKRAYRMGAKSNKMRPICTVLTNLSDKAAIYSNISNLKGLKNKEGCYYHIYDQLPSRMMEARQKKQGHNVEEQDICS